MKGGNWIRPPEANSSNSATQILTRELIVPPVFENDKFRRACSQTQGRHLTIAGPITLVTDTGSLCQSEMASR
jgi:hypothetical protein